MRINFLVLLLLCLFCSCHHHRVYRALVYNNNLTGYYFLLDAQRLLILDKTGNIIYYKTPVVGMDFALQPNGLMSYGVTDKFYFMDSTFTETDSISCIHISGTDPRDLRILPHGHFLMLGADTVRMNLSQYYFDGGRGSDTALVSWAVVQEVDSLKNVIFEWHARNHFNFSDADTSFLHSRTSVDFTHANAIELDTDGNILLSCRNLNEITKISHKDGSVIWRFGGKHNQFKFMNCPIPFYGQHDIRRISNGDITLFDNGTQPVPHPARAMEFKLDEVNKTATLTWSYTLDSTLYSKAKGNVQRLANHCTLINYGDQNNHLCFVVIDSTGCKLMQVNGLASYRVLYYAALPWQLHRPRITCYDSAGTTYLDAGPGYTSYNWNTGATSRMIRALRAGNYSVFVPYGPQGYISSESFAVTNPDDPCNSGKFYTAPEK